MQLTARHDVDVPAEQLFDAIADFDRLERMMVRRGAKVTRLEPTDASPMAWALTFDWRGRRRDLRLAVSRFDRPETIEMRGDSDSFDISLKANVVALSRQRSRLMVTSDIEARTLKARLLLQTAKLTRASIDRKFAERVASFAEGLARGSV